jgi:hypothetical protein
MNTNFRSMAISNLKTRAVTGAIRFSAMVLAALTAAAVFVPAVIGIDKSDAALACGGRANTIQAEFNIARPSAIWRVFPAMLRAPELEEDSQPAHVVVFAGEVNLEGMIRVPGPIPKVKDAVCIIMSDGTVNFYDSVSKAGAKLPK